MRGEGALEISTIIINFKENFWVTVRLWAFGISCKKQTGRQGTKLLQLQSIRLSAEYHTQLLDKTSIW
jgi:hypothetical protein